MKNEKPIGIMQGRLSPPTGGRIQCFPKTTWRKEFYDAGKAEISHIEWIYEADEWERNPLSTEEGRKEVLETMRITGVTIESVCADYFMDIPYLTAEDEMRQALREKLAWLVESTAEIGAKYIDLPFVDASKIGSREEFPLVMEFVKPALQAAEKKGIIIALETALNPEDFRELLTRFGHPNLMANYDTGNSSGIGYNCKEELTAYGKWIRTVHIKDRVLHGTTVPLGTGSADFDTFFRELARLDYGGPIVLQAAREGDEIETAGKNVKFVRDYLKRSQS